MKPLDGKVLGIIGGMGPLATSTFYNMIIDKTDAECDQDHINMILLNHATMPDRTAAIKEGNGEIIKEKLYRDAKYLEESGACCIAVPCNTSHFVLGEVAEQVNIPIINMIEEGVLKVIRTEAQKGVEQKDIKVGIMATDGTIQFGLYHKECEKKGLTPVEPDPEVQKVVMKIIYEGVKVGKPVDPADFYFVANHFKEKGCNCVLLACTELSVLKVQRDLPDYFVDAMEALTEKAVELCKGEYIKIRR